MRFLGTGSSRRKRRLAERLTFSAKVSRLKLRLKEPQWCQYAKMLVVGKVLGLAVLAAILFAGPKLTTMFGAMMGSPTAHAQETATAETEKAEAAGTETAAAPETPPDATATYPDTKAADIINPINTGWVLLGAFLVFGMQAGFTMLEAGFCRSRETVNVLVECVFDTCVCGLLHWAMGLRVHVRRGQPLHRLARCRAIRPRA